MARKFIAEIIYGEENIKIRLILRQNPQDFGDLKSPALLTQGGAQWLGREKENSTPPENKRFVFERLAPAVGFEPTT